MSENVKLKMQWRDTFRHNVLISGIMILIGLIMPAIINVDSFHIYESLYLSLDNTDQGLFVITALKLVMMNSIRILPVYMAAYNILEFIRPNEPFKRRMIFLLSGVLIIPLFYKAVQLIYGVKYHFGMPSIIIILFILVFVIRDLINISIIKKAITVGFLTLALQWLDIMPELSVYGFGRGDVSTDLKMFSEVLGADNALSFSAITFFTIFLINALMIFKFLKDQDTVVKTMKHQKQMEKEISDLNMQTLKARTSEEMEYLVHDLKSPLTSIQALVSFSEMLLDDPKVISYMRKINVSVDQLNEMISQILHENRKQSTSVQEIFESVLSQLSPTKGSDTIKYINDCGDILIDVNKIRFTRMIINILNNSLSATNYGEGLIKMTVFDTEDDVLIKIADNGIGIDSGILDRIKEKGFSTKGSSGIGLQYVEKVVTNHGGTLVFDSEVNVGTTVTITIPKGEVYEKDFNH